MKVDINLSADRKAEALRLLDIMEERKKDYWIISTKLQEHQLQVIPYIRDKVDKNWVLLPEYKWILFQWGNRSGKTFLLMYIVVCLALGELTETYWLPFLGKKKNIWLITKSGSNVDTTIVPYLLWDYSKTKIPPDAIKHIKNNNSRPEVITLKSGCKITILTYDQGRERLQWGTPDFIAVDEEPTDKWVWDEIMVRLSEWQSQMMLSMTPLSGLTPVYEFFYEREVPEWMADRRKTFLVSSLENEHWDHSGLLMLSPEEQKARMYGQFVPTTWLVFYAFNRKNNLIKHFNPKELWYGTKYYAWLDFWVNHPTAFVLLAIDTDWNAYAFDWFCRSNMLLEDIASEIKRLHREYWIEPEYIIADSAAKRERTELRKYWIITTPADKFSKWENGESNRKAGILKMNQLFTDCKLVVSDKLMKSLVKELETHHYADNWKDGAVIKENDDFIDALRYVIFSLKPTKVKSKAVEEFEKKYWVTHNKNNYYKESYIQAY